MRHFRITRSERCEDYIRPASSFSTAVLAAKMTPSNTASIGDAILKLNQAEEGFMGERNIRALTGMESDAQ